MECHDSPRPIIIVGAGIVGLTLAQGLKMEGIPFQIYERDEAVDQRSSGWGITIHWALEALESCLPQELYKKIDGVQVDPEQGRQDTGRFLFLDLETLKPRYIIPPSPRKRINRSKFRALLTEGLNYDIHWGKSLSSFSLSPSVDGNGNGNGVTVTFTDETTVQGSMLIAADGSNSKTRHLLLSEAGQLNPLPARFMGVTVVLSEEKIKPLRSIDPLLFLGSHPGTGHFMWFSVLSTPEANGSSSTGTRTGTAGPYYEAQINLSWLVKGSKDDEEVPATDFERLARMKAMAQGFHVVLRRAIENIPDGTPVQVIKLEDWPTMEWEGDGMVTLLGDAAHAMTMYRGEAANHGFTDAAKLTEQLKLWYNGSKTQEQALRDFEIEMRQRTHRAVLLSRQACLDAHDINHLGPDSPVVSMRARVLEPGLKA
ncbi:FAD/NAD(P)-binding domain-containing protein [Xylariaceae sp. AK1471]|nr:FAD/NAD(P)-binding domain-containing protein [Xylariaceae sp. AK1471]